MQETQEIATEQSHVAAGEPGAGNAVVFGKFDVSRKGKPQRLGPFAGTNCSALVLPENSNEALFVGMDDHGRFTWALRPGNYTLLDYRCDNNWHFAFGRMNAPFSVAANDAAVYVGRIQVELEEPRTGPEMIRDDEAAALKKFKALYPDSTVQPVKRLLQPQQEVGSYSRIRSICHPSWASGVECSRSLWGVSPIDPPIQRGLHEMRFIDIKELEPTFRWKPSSGEGIAYDVGIWEAVSYTPNGMARLWVPGRLVYLAENIDRPELALPEPLRPKTRYYWSVRLRRGDIVSSWSVAGHDLFLPLWIPPSTALPTWISYSGQPFAFRTP